MDYYLLPKNMEDSQLSLILSMFGSRYYLGRPYHFKFFKGCLPQILLGPFLNTLTHTNQFDKFSGSHPEICSIKNLQNFVKLKAKLLSWRSTYNYLQA